MGSDAHRESASFHAHCVAASHAPGLVSATHAVCATASAASARAPNISDATRMTSGAQNAASTSDEGSIQAHLPSAWAAHASSEEERARHSEAREAMAVTAGSTSEPRPSTHRRILSRLHDASGRHAPAAG